MHKRLLSVLLAAAWFVSIASADEPKRTTPPPESILGTEAGQVRDDNGLAMKLVWCPPGAFMMGDVDINDLYSHAPARTFVTQGFWLGRFEATQKEWKQIMATEPWKGRTWVKEGDDFPATCVDWHVAMAFCRKLTDQERKAGRLPDHWEYMLPTDAQWERACRAGTETQYSFGDKASELGEYAWYEGTASEAGERYAHRVGQKKPNPWGLYDMHGNVWEWCRDVYEGLPGGRDPLVEGPQKNAADNGGLPADRVDRGGCWGEEASACRSSRRAGLEPGIQGDMFLGFRVALTPVRPAADNQAK